MCEKKGCCCKKPEELKTRPEDWEDPSVDLTGFIRMVNRAKARNPVFTEETPLELLPCDNPNILFFWKGSLRARQEALIILNKDIHEKQHFRNCLPHCLATITAGCILYTRIISAIFLRIG